MIRNGESTSGAARALEKMVTLSSDREDQTKRFGELVMTAVEQVSDGSLGRAVTLLDLADRMVAEQKVDQITAGAVRGQAEAILTEERLLELAEQEDHRLLLRRLMRFFPRYSTEELFFGLETETNRDRRRKGIRLLAVHGAEARTAAVARLTESVNGKNPAPWFLERNLVYLMRTIPRPIETPADPEIDLLVQTSDLAAPLPLVRESLAALGQLRHQRAEQTLIARVSELEQSLLGEIALPHSPDELIGLLDSVATMLARSPSRAVRRMIFSHGCKRQAALGDTAARLTALAGQDLSNDLELVRDMLAQLQAELPVKVFGLAVTALRRSRLGEAVVEALSGTDMAETRQALSDVVARFPNHSLGQTASRVLADFDGRRSQAVETSAEPVSVRGDLGVFGLPNLLQNLADSRLTGRLAVSGIDGTPLATVDLSGGMVRSASVGRLSGPTAVYDLLTRPRNGSFAFTAEQPSATPNEPTETLYSVQHLLLEGMRRYDELVRATALVPDDARFTATDLGPTSPDESIPAETVTSVWTRASAGASPAECERSLTLDAYQVRRLYEHWFETGALVPRASSG